MGFFDSKSETYSSTSYTEANTNTNLDYSLSQVQNTENNLSNYQQVTDSYNTQNVADYSFRALDSYNKNINYQLANVGNVAVGEGAMDLFKGMGLDLGSFFSNAPVPFMAGANRDVNANEFLGGSSKLGTTALTQGTTKMGLIVVGIVVLVIGLFFFLRRKK